MIFNRLENIREDKRTNLSVGSSDFISLNPLKTFFLSSSVSEVLMVKNLDKSRYSLSAHVLSDMTHVLSDSSDVLTVSSGVLSDSSGVLYDLTHVLSLSIDVLCVSSNVLIDSSEGLLNLSEELSDFVSFPKVSTQI